MSVVENRLQVRLNRSLTLPRRGVTRVTLPIEILDNAFAGGSWQRRCRIEGVLDEHGHTIAASFLPNGVTSLTLPADVAGEVLLVFELENERMGRQLSGSCSLRVDRHEGSGPIHVVAGGHHVESWGQVYQPIDIRSAGGEKIEVAGDKLHIAVDLFEEDKGGAVSVQDLSDREEFLVLPDRGDGIARVLSIDFGPDLVLGRCYSWQLEERPKAKLEQLGLSQVNWVTCWDDDALNRLWARLAFRSGSDERIEIRNLTDYSLRPRPIVVCAPAEAELVVSAGAALDVPVTPHRWLEICAGEGTNRRVLARTEFDLTTVGSAAVPVLRTADSTFRYPPGGGPDAIKVHFLGVWIPWPAEKLCTLLEASREELPVAFDRDEVYLWFRYRRDRRMLMASSNVDLRASMAAR